MTYKEVYKLLKTANQPLESLYNADIFDDQQSLLDRRSNTVKTIRNKITPAEHIGVRSRYTPGYKTTDKRTQLYTNSQPKSANQRFAWQHRYKMPSNKQTAEYKVLYPKTQTGLTALYRMVNQRNRKEKAIDQMANVQEQRRRAFDNPVFRFYGIQD